MVTPGLAGVGQFGRPPLDSGLKFGSGRGDFGSGRPLRSNVAHPALACGPGSRTTLRVTMPTSSRAAGPGLPQDRPASGAVVPACMGQVQLGSGGGIGDRQRTGSRARPTGREDER
jgi:hypothetical protein